LDANFKEIYEVKKRYPDNVVIASLMVETKEEWQEIIKRSVDAGADGLELNFGCPHGMCERGMGSVVAEEPKVLEEITSWAKEFSNVPVFVKLSPNVIDIRDPGLAAVSGGCDGISLINTIKSIIGVDLDTLVPKPSVGRESTNGGYCGPAIKPIALHMAAVLAKDPQINVPISGIGGISTWQDIPASELLSILLATTIMVGAVMVAAILLIAIFKILGNFLGKSPDTDNKGKQG
jgi:dihydropyrimidine dehydrogenase (NAD+) subunit PreA